MSHCHADRGAADVPISAEEFQYVKRGDALVE
jgi:hypothetical protein